MKKNVSPKSKRANNEKALNPRVVVDEAKILRTVGMNEAFHFYEALGKPTGENAKNLSDFLDKVKSVRTESLLFHLERRDFESWIEKTLGDTKLAGQLDRIRSSNSGDVRMSICRTVEGRIKELSEPAASLAEENSTVLMLSS